jgi:hypothetical protein
MGTAGLLRLETKYRMLPEDLPAGFFFFFLVLTAFFGGIMDNFFNNLSDFKSFSLCLLLCFPW